MNLSQVKDLIAKVTKLFIQWNNVPIFWLQSLKSPFFTFQIKRMAGGAATIPNLSEDVSIEELGDSEELKQVSAQSNQTISPQSHFSFGIALEGTKVENSKMDLSGFSRLAR